MQSAESSGGNLRLSTTCSAPFSEPMVVKQPQFTRVEEPTLLCNQVDLTDNPIASPVVRDAARASRLLSLCVPSQCQWTPKPHGSPPNRGLRWLADFPEPKPPVK